MLQSLLLVALPTTSIASITPADALSSVVSRRPMTLVRRLGTAPFIDRLWKVLCLGHNLTPEIINLLFLLLNLVNVFAIEKLGKSVFSLISLTEGLRPRPTWHASSILQKKNNRFAPG